MGRIYDATWGRGFAALYDRAFDAAEDAGLREMRRQALAAASGRTADLGAGTGANLGLYPGAVTDLVLVEPGEHMLGKLREKVREERSQVEIVQAPAESLPFADDSIDTAVFTLVLCTVPNPEAAIAEARRVLRPGGRLLFLEHVRSEDPGLAGWQDRLESPWRFIADGCHCNRETLATIERDPALTLEAVEPAEFPKAPGLVRPLIHGSAILGN